jgi:hypothetical protein
MAFLNGIPVRLEPVAPGSAGAADFAAGDPVAAGSA